MNLTALLIDHDDSFTQNVRSWLSEKFDVQILNHAKISERDQTEKFDLIVFSPGPRSAQDYPQSLKFLLSLQPNQHVLGICLGMQMIAIVSGGSVHTYAPPLHGKTSALKSADKKINGLVVGRYHSMACELPLNQFNVIATSENIPMWVTLRTKTWMGIQFHPESFLTESAGLYLDYLVDWILT